MKKILLTILICLLLIPFVFASSSSSKDLITSAEKNSENAQKLYKNAVTLYEEGIIDNIDTPLEHTITRNLDQATKHAEEVCELYIDMQEFFGQKIKECK